jgi:hypothetical protein
VFSANIFLETFNLPQTHVFGGRGEEAVLYQVLFALKGYEERLKCDCMVVGLFRFIYLLQILKQNFSGISARGYACEELQYGMIEGGRIGPSSKYLKKIRDFYYSE